MLAPIRDHLSPKDPMSAPLLCSTKERYFSRLSADVYPGKPGFEEARWITSEDANVEHLLDVFTAIDVTSGGVWVLVLILEAPPLAKTTACHAGIKDRGACG
jgi:hypothetical protein